MTFVGKPPIERVRRAAGVSDVQTSGVSLLCSVQGSFQPFLEALRGHEVTDLLTLDMTNRSGHRAGIGRRGDVVEH